MTKTNTDFFPAQYPVAQYGSQLGRNTVGVVSGMMEVNTSTRQIPANAQLFFEIVIPNNLKDNGSGHGEIALIYKDNHNAERHTAGKYNIVVTLEFIENDTNTVARYAEKVELGVEDDHSRKSIPLKLECVKYQNTEVIMKYQPGDDPVKAIGSYQDTKDGGVRYKLTMQDPDTKEWKKIFDHVDYGDENHDIKNYRGSSAFQSSIRIYGITDSFDSEDLQSLEYLEGREINIVKTAQQTKALSKLGYGNITFKEIEPDDGKWDDGMDDPLSYGKKPSFSFWRRK